MQRPACLEPARDWLRKVGNVRVRHYATRYGVDNHTAYDELGRDVGNGPFPGD